MFDVIGLLAAVFAAGFVAGGLAGLIVGEARLRKTLVGIERRTRLKQRLGAHEMLDCGCLPK